MFIVHVHSSSSQSNTMLDILTVIYTRGSFRGGGGVLRFLETPFDTKLMISIMHTLHILVNA